MSLEHPTILYIGDTADGETLLCEAAKREWYVYLPEDVLTALGMYITYWPDVVVIDTNADPVLVGETYLHIRSVTDPDGSPQLMILLCGADDWEENAAGGVYVLPRNLRAVELLKRIGDLIYRLQAQREHAAYVALSLLTA